MDSMDARANEVFDRARSAIPELSAETPREAHASGYAAGYMAALVEFGPEDRRLEEARAHWRTIQEMAVEFPRLWSPAELSKSRAVLAEKWRVAPETLSEEPS